ncbi:DUF6318 family protein [Kribbella sp. GL6]|uniref:DUF6318 family protein n=1 Tax=Kribbella sp. GL6 TaxID=3419765 RepID=UPI003D01097F
MTYRKRPQFTLAVCFAITTCLTACAGHGPAASESSDASPSTSSTGQTASTTGSATPPAASAVSTTPPPRPAAAEGLTLAAAEQFVRYYSDLLNYASATGDTAPMLDVSEKGCVNCKSYADFVAKANAANGLLQGDYLEKITGVPEVFRDKSGRIGGSATLTVGAYVSRNSKNASPIRLKSTKYTREFALSQQGGNWIMYEMELKRQ